MKFLHIWYCVIVEATINVFLHAISLLLLATVYTKRRRDRKTQLVLLSNFCASEFLGNVYNLLFALFHLYNKSELAHCVYRIIAYPSNITFFAGLFLITADRLAASSLELRYKTICTVSRAKKIVLVTYCAPNLLLPSGFAVVLPVRGTQRWSELWTKLTILSSQWYNFFSHSLLRSATLSFLFTTSRVAAEVHRQNNRWPEYLRIQNSPWLWWSQLSTLYLLEFLLWFRSPCV